MITRVFRGRSAHGLIKYLFGEGRRNEHTDAHLIASWDGDPSALEPSGRHGRHDVGGLVRTLEQPVRVCDRAPEQYVYHLAIRTAPEDRRLSDAEWSQVCRAAMERTGIAPAGDPSGCRWVAVRHADDHVHVVATLAREDGRAPRIWNDFGKLAAVRHEFEQRFGLRDTSGRDDHTAPARPGVKEQLAAQKHGRTVPPRVVLRRRVAAAAAVSTDFAGFTDVLRRSGVTVWPRMSERVPGQVTGYSVSLDDWRNGAGEPVRFGGGKLAQDLTLPKLHARWSRDDRSTSSTRSRSLAGPAADGAWREAERIVREAADRIHIDSRTDPASAADTAWAASDAMHGLAWGREGPAGGPLTDAADDFARAGRMADHRLPRRSNDGAALRTAGRMIAVLIAGQRHPAAQIAAVSIAMTTLIAAVADLRRAQGRVHQAESAVTADRLLRRHSDLLLHSVSRHETTLSPRVHPSAAQLAAASIGAKSRGVDAGKPDGTIERPASHQTDDLRLRGSGVSRR